jgi:hypothetical protein
MGTGNNISNATLMGTEDHGDITAAAAVAATIAVAGSAHPVAAGGSSEIDFVVSGPAALFYSIGKVLT